MSSKLPGELTQLLIAHMKVGDSGYTVPWAMWADVNGDLWIHGGYPVWSESGGTGHMHIERTETDMRVRKSTIGDYKYTPEARKYDILSVSFRVELT